MAHKSSAAKIGGLGLAALAATAAAAFYFSGKDGKQRRKHAAAWTKKAGEDMVERIKKMKTVSAKAYHGAAKEVLDKYKKLKHVKPEELAAFGKELKGHWDQIYKNINKLGAAKSAAKNVTKKKPARRKK